MPRRVPEHHSLGTLVASKPDMSAIDPYLPHASPVTPLPPLPVEVPHPASPQPTGPGPNQPQPSEPNIEEPAIPDENPFPRVVPQPIATPEE